MTARKWLFTGAAIGWLAIGQAVHAQLLPAESRLSPIDTATLIFVDTPDVVPFDPTTAEPRGYTPLPNPARGHIIAGTVTDPLAAFSRRPLDIFDIPEGGLYLDPLHDGLHFGVDYANADDYLSGRPTYFYPIGSGYVTTRSSCVLCFADGNRHGQVGLKAPRYNFGWGGLVLVESPYSPDISIYVLYGHIARDFVSLGDYVTPDEVLGVVGTSGYSEAIHLHVEVRYGAPGRFWNADFTQMEVRDRWLATRFANPAALIFPENHWAFTLELADWAAQQDRIQQIP